MAEETTGKALLENSYKLATPGDNAAYYNSLAPSYDIDFVVAMGYQYPRIIADAYLRQAQDADRPIADIGCGTGLVAVELKLPASVIDGFDISPEMLAIAKDKQTYRKLFEVDLTAPLDQFAGAYGAVLSAGTFTHGHLGPAPLPGLLAMARAGGLFIIGVNKAHFDAQNFAAVLEALTSTGKITAPTIDIGNMYSKSGHEHSNDRALIVQFRKL